MFSAFISNLDRDVELIYVGSNFVLNNDNVLFFLIILPIVPGVDVVFV